MGTTSRLEKKEIWETGGAKESKQACSRTISSPTSELVSPHKSIPTRFGHRIPLSTYHKCAEKRGSRPRSAIRQLNRQPNGQNTMRSCKNSSIGLGCSCWLFVLPHSRRDKPGVQASAVVDPANTRHKSVLPKYQGSRPGRIEVHDLKLALRFR